MCRPTPTPSCGREHFPPASRASRASGLTLGQRFKLILRLATVDPAACDCEAMFDTAQRCEVDAGINKTSAWVEFLKHCKDEPLTEGEKEKIESAMHEAGEPLLNNAELAVDRVDG